MSGGISRACVSRMHVEWCVGGTHTAIAASRQAHERSSQGLDKISRDLGLESALDGARIPGSVDQDVLQRTARSLIAASITSVSWVPAPDNTE